MADILPRNVVVGMVVFFFMLTAGIFMISNVYSGVGIDTPDAVTNLTTNIDGAKTNIEEFAEATETSFTNESNQGFVTKSCTTLLGDDNFFCAGLKTLGQYSKAPEKLRLTINAFNKSFPVAIPYWVINTFVSIIVTILVFVGISAWRRWKS